MTPQEELKAEAKIFFCFHIPGVTARTKVEERLSQCRHFSDKEEEGQFAIFCVDVFYGRLLNEKLGLHKRP